MLCPALVPARQEGCGQNRDFPKEGHGDDPRAGKPALGEKTEGVGSLLLGEDMGGTSSVFEYLKGSYRGGGGSLVTRRQDATGVASGEVSSQYKTDIFYSENIHWNNLPRDVAKSPRLEVFKMPLDKV